MSAEHPQLPALLSAVQQSSKYKHVAPAFITRIGGEELAKGRSLKEAIKATKNKLHQTGAAYQHKSMRYERWLDALRAAHAEDDTAALREACADAMGAHASTRERLPILDEFYKTLFAEVGPIRSVLDVACGLNPLSIPWMGLDADVTYTAFDIYTDMMGFIADVGALVAPSVITHIHDAGAYGLEIHVDVALILKTLPCLEQVEREISLRLLQAVQARYLIVSFPVQSLGGRDKGMALHYEAHLRNLLNSTPQTAAWPVSRYEFETELAFIIEKNAL